PRSHRAPCLGLAGDALTGAFQRGPPPMSQRVRSEEHTSELQSLTNVVCRLLLEKKPVNLAKRLNQGFNRDASVSRFHFVQADVGNLRIRVSTPGDGQCAPPVATQQLTILRRAPS